VVTYLSARGPEAEVERFAAAIRSCTSSSGYPLSAAQIAGLPLHFYVPAGRAIARAKDKRLREARHAMRSSIVNHDLTGREQRLS